MNELVGMPVASLRDGYVRVSASVAVTVLLFGPAQYWTGGTLLHYLGEGSVGRVRESFASAYDTLVHAATETSFVTVWVLGAYLVYEYGQLLTGADAAALVVGLALHFVWGPVLGLPVFGFGVR